MTFSRPQVLLATKLRTMVLGGVNIKGGLGPVRSFVASSTIGGSVQVEENTNQVNVRDSMILGDVQVSKNTGPASFVSRNTVGGNLQCTDNNPAPVNASVPLPAGWPVGLNLGSGPNTVGGNKEDQCSAALGF